MTVFLIYAAVSAVLVLVFPRMWLAGALAAGLAILGLSGMYYENIPPDPGALARGIVIFSAVFFGLLAGLVAIRKRLTRKGPSTPR